MKAYMVIGVGRFGSAVAETLFNMGNEVVILDTDESAVNHAADLATHAAIGDARDIEVLRAVGASECDTAIVAMGEDLAASVLIAMNLKDLGVKTVICKAKNEQFRRVLERIGVDRVVIPEREMGVRMAQNLVSGSFLDYIELSDRYGIADFRAPKGWFGKTLKDLDVRNRYSLTILGLKKNGSDELQVSPGADTVIPEGCTVMAMGDRDALDRMKAL